MKSIKTALMISFSIIIGSMLMLNIAVTAAHFNIESEYKKITDNMVLEYSITETFSGMVAAYTSLLQDIGDQELHSEYFLLGEELESLFSRLDTSILSEESRITYNKIKNMAKSVKDECDKSLANVEERNFTGGSGIYDRAIKGEEYINENTAKLLLSELKYSKGLQETLELSRNSLIFISVALIILVTGGCIFYGIGFSNRISKPLIKLSDVAKNISEGKTGMQLKKDLLENPNREINSLASSFNVMVNKLRDKINLLEEANAFASKAKNELERSKTELESRNDELERFNKLAVGRELKMIELKKKIEELGSKKK
jgi:HAMP domain-containing protein